MPVPVAAVVDTASTVPANLNLNWEQETKEETQKRIKSRLCGLGFPVTDKMMAKIVDTVPDNSWLLPGYDYPTYLAQEIKRIYASKQPQDRLKLFYSVAMPKEGMWTEQKKAYPNWINGMLGNVVAKAETTKRNTPPTKHCPKCGETVKLEGLHCPKCAGWYEWDNESQKMEWYIHTNLDFSGGLKSLLASCIRKEEELKNARAG